MLAPCAAALAEDAEPDALCALVSALCAALSAAVCALSAFSLALCAADSVWLTISPLSASVSIRLSHCSALLYFH